MLRREKVAIASIYVPVQRRATLKPEIVRQIAQSMLEVGQQVPILVRPDGDRFRPRRRFASARSMQGIGRRDDLRIPYPGPEALIACMSAFGTKRTWDSDLSMS